MSMTFRENHLAFAAKRFDDFISIEDQEQDSVCSFFKSQKTIGSRTLPPMTMGKSPLDRIKHESGYLSPLIRSLTTSPAGSCNSRDGSPFSKRLNIRGQVSLTRKRLVNLSDSATNMTTGSGKMIVSSSDSLEDAADELRTFLTPWTEGFTKPVTQRCFTSTAKSHVHMIKSISSQRALMGGDCIYSVGDGLRAPTVSLDENEGADDAIDQSLKKNMYDDMRLDEFLMEHHSELQLDAEEMLDTISDCTDDENECA